MDAPMEPDEDVIDDWVYPSADPAGRAAEVKLTDRNLLFYKAYLETANVVQSMKAAGYTDDDEGLRTSGYRLLRKIHVPLPAIMRAHGMTLSSLVGTLRDAQTSHKMSRIKMREAVELTDDDGQPVLNKNGSPKVTIQDVVREYVDVDHTTRLRAAELGLRLLKQLGNRDSDPPASPASGSSWLMPLVGMQAEEDLEAEEEQEARDVPDAELRSDIAEIQRKLRLIGFELTPVASPAEIAAMPSANAEPPSTGGDRTNRTEKPKP